MNVVSVKSDTINTLAEAKHQEHQKGQTFIQIINAKKTGRITIHFSLCVKPKQQCEKCNLKHVWNKLTIWAS